MVSANQPDLHAVDWSKIPAPLDDGGAAHLMGLTLPSQPLPATNGASIDLTQLPGRAVVFAYPRTGVPGEISVVPEWDQIPGARGCTPQSCAFRDLYAELQSAGARHVFGLSVQSTAYQREAHDRLHLPFELLSDETLSFAAAARLPVMEAGGMKLLRRHAWIADDGCIVATFYPVFPPDRNAGDVLAWLRANPALGVNVPSRRK